MSSEDGDSIRVVVRVRPFTPRESGRNCACCVEMEGNTCWLLPSDKDEHKEKRDFRFDNCYWSHNRSHPNYASQDTVFEDIGKLALNNAFSGYNVCVFAYGQTGAGKSYSMVGSPEDKGIVPRVAMSLFDYIERQKAEHDNMTFEVMTSMIEIYSEKIRDLLGKGGGGLNGVGQKSNLKVREDPKLGPYVEGLTAMTASSYKEIERQLAMGNNARSVASTHMNDVSSRAHTIFSIKFSQTIAEEIGDGVTRETKKVSKINLVDLAGSERQSNKQLSASEQARFKEGIAINKSLSALSNCIFALYKQSQETGKDGKKVHVPYRDSQLTWLLKESLGGNAKTIMLAAISPADINFEESLSTLQYAARAKRIKTNAVVNEDINNKIIRELRAEIEKLRQQVAGQQQDNEVEELRRQLLESKKMIEQMNSTFQEQLNSNNKPESQPARGGRPSDTSVPQLVNLSEDPMMTECLVYYVSPGTTVLGTDVDEGETGEGPDLVVGIPLVGQSIAPRHCTLSSVDGKVFLEPLGGALTFVNGKKISEQTELKQGNRIVLGSSHIFRFHDPIEASKLRKEREDYMAEHPNEAVTAPSVIDWNYATQELNSMNNFQDRPRMPLSASESERSLPDEESPREHRHHHHHPHHAGATRDAKDFGVDEEDGGLVSESEEEEEESEDEDEDEDFIPLDGVDGGGGDSRTASGEGQQGEKPVLAGIGVLVQRLGGQVTVVDLVAGGPAALSGELRIGQVVLEVDGRTVDTLSFTKVLQLIRGPVGSWISLMVQDPVQQGGSGVRILRLQRGLLPAKPVEDEDEDGEEFEEEEEDEEEDEDSSEAEALGDDDEEEALDLETLGEGGGSGKKPHHAGRRMSSHMVSSQQGLVKSEMTGTSKPKGRSSSSAHRHNNHAKSPGEEGGIVSESDDEDESDEDDETESGGSEMLNLEDMAEAESLERLLDSSGSDEDVGESLESFEDLSQAPTSPQQQQQAPSAAAAAPAGQGSNPAVVGGHGKSAPLCIKIDVEPTNKSATGYSLMFNVETVAAGLRYGVSVRDHKTMLKVYPRCFCGPDALDWLTQHALKAFLTKEKVEPGQPVGERLNILSRSAALLLAQRLVETEVFSQVNKTKARNPFTDQGALFRFREDEKAGPVLNTRHAWNCRARPPVVVAADLLHKAIMLHLQHQFPTDSSPEYADFLQVAEELQMVDISLLFRKAETSFFINLHNALMLHTHYYRKTQSGDNLKPLKNKLAKLHQYKVGGQCYCIDDMRRRLLRQKQGAKCEDPRIHFALSLGSMSCPDVRVFGVDELEDQLTEAAKRFCDRHVRVDISSDRSSHSTTTLLLPKLFKWHGKVFGQERQKMLHTLSGWVEDSTVQALLQDGSCKIKYPDYDWRKRPAGAPP